jgi:Asp/Glu/hydantoin racemase
MTRAQGGYNLYGRSIGILMLKTRFPRIPGDMGNATSFPFPVVHRVVEAATPDRVVTAGDADLLDPFIDAARELEREGVLAITTNCGFLAMFQPELAAAVDVPVFTSSLLLVPMLRRMLPPSRQIGILTVEARSLTERHFRGAGWSSREIPVVVAGMDGRYFNERLIGNQIEFDVELMERDVVDAACSLLERHPDVGALLLECTNMAPYARAIQRAIDRPVWDIMVLLDAVQDSLHRRAYSGYMR